MTGCLQPWAGLRVCGRVCCIVVEFPLVFISSAFAQTAPAAAAGGDMMSTLTGMLPLVLMFVVLYFIMIRPQMKRQKEHRAMVQAIAKGDEVVIGRGLPARVFLLSAMAPPSGAD